MFRYLNTYFNSKRLKFKFKCFCIYISLVFKQKQKKIKKLNWNTFDTFIMSM